MSRKCKNSQWSDLFQLVCMKGPCVMLYLVYLAPPMRVERLPILEQGADGYNVTQNRVYVTLSIKMKNIYGP